MSGKNKKSKNKCSSSNSQVKPEALAKQTKQAVQDVPAKQTKQAAQSGLQENRDIKAADYQKCKQKANSKPETNGKSEPDIKSKSTGKIEVATENQPVKFRRISVEGVDDRMPHSKPAKKSLHADSNLDMLGMSKKQRRAARKELYQKNTEGMSRREKFSYFFDYYKWRVITPILVVAFLCYLGGTIYMNKRPVALGFVVLNAQDADIVNLSFEDDYIDHFGITSSYQFKESVGLDIDYDYYLEHSEYVQTSNSTDYSILSSDCDLGSYDVIISNATGVKYCAAQNIAKPLKGYLSEDAYAKLEPYMVEFNDPNGTARTYAIDISDTQFAKDLDTGYADVYVAFPGVIDRNYTNSLRLLNYVLGIDLTE